MDEPAADLGFDHAVDDYVEEIIAAELDLLFLLGEECVEFVHDLFADSADADQLRPGVISPGDDLHFFDSFLERGLEFSEERVFYSEGLESHLGVVVDDVVSHVLFLLFELEPQHPFDVLIELGVLEDDAHEQAVGADFDLVVVAENLGHLFGVGFGEDFFEEAGEDLDIRDHLFADCPQEFAVLFLEKLNLLFEIVCGVVLLVEDFTEYSKDILDHAAVLSQLEIDLVYNPFLLELV